MKVEKRTIARLPRAYSIISIPELAKQGIPALVAGSEGDGPLVYITPPEFDTCTVLADSPGGFVSLCPLTINSVPHVLAAADFKPGFQGENARVLAVDLTKPSDNVGELFSLPYVHRIAGIRSGDLVFLSTLCGSKMSREDWSQPGAIYTVSFSSGKLSTWRMSVLANGFHKNHGFEAARLQQQDGFLISCGDGLFWIPQNTDPNVQEQARVKIDDGEYSDAFAVPATRGEMSAIFSISPFHGHLFALHQFVGGTWCKQVIWSDLAFGHIIWSGTLGNKLCIITGSRRDRMELRMYIGESLPVQGDHYEIIDEGVGAAQICIINRSNNALLMAVTAQEQEAVVLYEIRV